jgi:L-lactate dehydrogenase
MEHARLKIGVIGAGAVGTASLVSLVCRGDAGEIIVVNRDRKRARAVATDLQYGAALVPSVDIRDGDDQDLNGAAVVMITAGVNEKTGGATDRNDPAGRLRLLEPSMSDDERHALALSAETLRKAVSTFA